MKSLFLTALSLFILMGVNAQDAEKDMKKASRLIGSYRLDPTANADKLPEARTLIDGAMSGGALDGMSKAWLTYGEIYQEVLNGEVRVLATDQSSPIASPLAAVEAIKGFTNAYEKAEKNFEKKDAMKGLETILNNTSYIASVLLSNGDYEKSYANYQALVSGNDFLLANGSPGIYPTEKDFQDQVYWTALAAFSAGKYGESEEYFMRLYNEDYDSPDIYSAMYDIKKRQNDEEGANAILQEGMQKYPGDKGLMFAEINDALAKGDLATLEDKLKKAMVTEPDNITIPTTLGNVYDQLYQQAVAAKDYELAEQHYNNAKIYFAKALEMDSEYFDAVYMMGAVEYNRAAEYAALLNELADDYSKEGTAKYEAMKEKMLGQFDKALPYFLEAEKLDGSDRNTLIALREIYARKDQLDKSEEYKTKLDNAGGGE